MAEKSFMCDRKELYKSNIIAKAITSNMQMYKKQKKDLETLYGQRGMTFTEAVNFFSENPLPVNRLPFTVRLQNYNRETEAAIQETRDILSGRVPAKSYGSVQELFDELDEACADPETGFVVKKQPKQEAQRCAHHFPPI